MFPKRSDAWLYFDLGEDCDGKKKTVCKMCSDSLAYYGGTSSMKNHLKYKHKHVLKNANNKRPSVMIMKPQQAVNGKQSVTVLDCHDGIRNISKESSTMSKYDHLNKKLALMCAMDLLPISMMDGEGFHNLVQTLDPMYIVPSSNTIAKYVGLIYAEIKEDVICELVGNDVSFTTDMWTSVDHKDYLTITCQYITCQWQLKSKVIATRPLDQHTAINIAEMLHAIAEEFRVSSVVTITTDNSSKMLSCGSVLAVDGITRIGCFTRNLQLAVNEGFNLPVMSRILAFAEKVAGNFSHSQPSRKTLLDNQSAHKNSDGISDIETHWNSSYVLLKRLLKIRNDVKAELHDETATQPKDGISLDLTDDTWNVMEQVVPILGPFVEATNMLISDNLPTLGSQYVLIKTLMSNIQDSKMDSWCEMELKKKISTEFMTRFHVNAMGIPNDAVVKESIHLICTILDPRYKTLRFLPDTQRQTVQNRLVEMMKSLEGDPVNVKSDDDVTPAKRLLLDCLAGDYIDSTCGAGAISQEMELQNYISEPVPVRDPLDWWKSNETKFPRLAALARKYLCVPATEVTSGRGIASKQASLDSDMIDELLFINHNYEFQGDSGERSPESPCSVTVEVNESRCPSPRGDPAQAGQSVLSFNVIQVKPEPLMGYADDD